jgi:hypothetical protein
LYNKKVLVNANAKSKSVQKEVHVQIDDNEDSNIEIQNNNLNSTQTTNKCLDVLANYFKCSKDLYTEPKQKCQFTKFLESKRLYKDNLFLFLEAQDILNLFFAQYPKQKHSISSFMTMMIDKQNTQFQNIWKYPCIDINSNEFTIFYFNHSQFQNQGKKYTIKHKVT